MSTLTEIARLEELLRAAEKHNQDGRAESLRRHLSALRGSLSDLDVAEQAEALALVLVGAGSVEEVAEVYNVEPAQFMCIVYPEPLDDSAAGASCTCRECTPTEKR